MSNLLSWKIKKLSLVSIVLVLYIHSGFHETTNEIAGMYFNIYLQAYISSKIARIAVPLFFMISGYLFFYNATEIKSIFEKIKRRYRSLLIPYLIAALFLPVFYWILYQVPAASKFINSQGVLNHFQNDIFKIFFHYILMQEMVLHWHSIFGFYVI